MEFACKESTKSLQKITRVVKEGNIKKNAMYTLLITKSNVHCTSYLSRGNLLLAKREWTYFGGKVVRQKPEFTPKKLLGAWINCPRKIGQHQKSCHNLTTTTLQIIIPNISKDGKFKDFYNLASNETMWIDTLKQYEGQLILILVEMKRMKLCLIYHQILSSLKKDTMKKNQLEIELKNVGP